MSIYGTKKHAQTSKKRISWKSEGCRDGTGKQSTVFIRIDAAATNIFRLAKMRRLFEGGV